MSLTRRSACDVGTGNFNLPPGSKNWAPGHYIELGGYYDEMTFNQILDRLGQDTAGHYKGIVLRFPWDQLETAFDVYSGFDIIENALNMIAGLGGRRLMILIHLKTFHSISNGVITAYNHAVPAYMDNNPIYADPDGFTNSRGTHGSYTYSSSINPAGGEVVNMHVDAVRDRFKKLIEAFAIRFNNNRYLEGFMITEASISKPYQVTVWDRYLTSTASLLNPPSNGWFDNMTDVFSHMRTHLTNISICQWINALRKYMKVWIPEQLFLIPNMGLGMPDLCKDTRDVNFNPTNAPNTAPGNIYYMLQKQGSSILVGHVSREAMNGSVLPKSQTAANAYPGQYAYPGLPWGPQDISNFAYSVGCTHVIWRHTPVTHNVNQTYLGQDYNAVVDSWIHNPLSDIKVVTTRPTGW